MEADKFIKAQNDPNRLELKGRLQHEIAAQALRHSGVNHDLAGSIEDFMDTHQRFTDDADDEAMGMTTGYSGEAADEARRDITFGLMTMGQDPKVPETDRQAAGVVLEQIHARQPQAKQ